MVQKSGEPPGMYKPLKIVGKNYQLPTANKVRTPLNRHHWLPLTPPNKVDFLQFLRFPLHVYFLISSKIKCHVTIMFHFFTGALFEMLGKHLNRKNVFVFVVVFWWKNTYELLSWQVLCSFARHSRGKMIIHCLLCSSLSTFQFHFFLKKHASIAS